ncbi:hypothetical protein BOX15_Mlig014532g1 [Macrostomum lignano]|uniref:Major facilitator superfamily (MFS) profile domain-containing protein n=1 Tax=Macrostomum lignano TaxID=282301 RepID=A0A267FA58_9PLAT|nr:hypothetical protein BOX15_Mlig014532g1 [Macrostomum lignano]
MSDEATMKTVDTVIDDIGFGWFQVAVLILCGFVQASDMLEIQYVSLVSQRLQCVWWISDYWKSFITSATFIGLFVGAYLWGPMGDKHCRRSVTAVCMGFIAVYGFLTALAPNVIWVVILRFLVGTGIGGVQPLTSAMFSEFMTSDTRGMTWFVFQGLWCLGGLVEIGFAWLLLDLQHGWRYLAVVTALPMLFLSLPWLLWLPVSPRQSLLQGRLAETRQALNKMADMNSQPRYLGDFTVTDLLQGKQKNGRISELIRPDTYLRLSLQLAFISFVGGFNYYGMILLNVQVPLLLHERCVLTDSATNVTRASPWQPGLDRSCHSCSPFNYIEMLIPTMADLVTALVNAFIIERFLGRRLIMAIAFCLASILIPLLSCCMDSSARIVLFFVIRFFIASGYDVVWLYVLEAYPTSLRSTAVGFHSSFSRIASILVPYVAQIFITRVSLLGGLLIFSGLLALATLNAALLPIETKAMPLAQTRSPQQIAADSSNEKQMMMAKSDEAVPGHQGYGSVNTPTKMD